MRRLALLLLAGCTLTPVVQSDDLGVDSDTDEDAVDTEDTTDTVDTEDTLPDTEDTLPDTDPPPADAPSVDYCHLQYPCEMTVAAGQTSPAAYAWVFHEGVTAGAGAGPGLEVELGWGPDGSTPDETWTWTPAAFNVDKDNNDEWTATLTAPSTAGTYDVTFRARLAGGGWTLCDLGNDGMGSCGGSAAGSSDGYSPTTAGTLTVE